MRWNFLGKWFWSVFLLRSCCSDCGGAVCVSDSVFVRKRVRETVVDGPGGIEKAVTPRNWNWSPGEHLKRCRAIVLRNQLSRKQCVYSAYTSFSSLLNSIAPYSILGIHCNGHLFYDLGQRAAAWLCQRKHKIRRIWSIDVSKFRVSRKQFIWSTLKQLERFISTYKYIYNIEPQVYWFTWYRTFWCRYYLSVCSKYFWI